MTGANGDNTLSETLLGPSPERRHYEYVGRVLQILQCHRYRIDNIEAASTKAELGVGQFSIAVMQGTSYVAAMRVTGEGEQYRVGFSYGAQRCTVDAIEGKFLTSSPGADALKVLLDG